jgi:hypothetical protein
MEQSLLNWGNVVLIAIVLIAVLALAAWGIFALVKRAARKGYEDASRDSASSAHYSAES